MPIHPTQEQLTELAALIGTDADGPLVMLNLNRYRDRAAYQGDPPGGENPDVTGREAYERYGMAAQTLNRVGGSIQWHTFAGMTSSATSDVYDDHRRALPERAVLRTSP